MNDTFNPAILDTSAPVVFFPVRHHSPACARRVRELARAMRPAAILIEGPSDFNARLVELTLPHTLPIAIYSYVRLGDVRRGAFYPFCDYSPEWVAVQTAHELDTPVRFIDLAWADILAQADAPAEAVAQRYADGELRRSDYVAALCEKLGVADFDTLWDTLFEIDDTLTVAQFMERCHRWCWQMRATDTHVAPEDVRREAFMAAQIRQAQADYGGPLLVVTGGFHSYALWERLHESRAAEGAPTIRGDKNAFVGQPFMAGQSAIQERGIALTPYAYERLDNLTGYESGMPHPGFYDHVWRDGGDTARAMLAEVATLLRERKQAVSAADLIAVEVMAEGLATLRGHKRVWRTDLVDGITGALVKEALDGSRHPFLEAVYTALRGDRRGTLADGAALPPLVHDLRDLLHTHDLEPQTKERVLTLNLVEKPADLARSRILHRLRALGITGYTRTGGSDFVGRADLTDVWERWTIVWTPDFDATCIQAAIYGPTLADAAGARLAEQADAVERDAARAALLLLDAALMGLDHLAPLFEERVVQLIRADGDFFGVAAALGHLLYLYRYDAVLSTAGRGDLAALLAEAWGRGLWLLEGLGRVEGRDKDLVAGVRRLRETYERCAALPQIAGALDRAQFVAVLHRVSTDPTQGATLRGATTGALWTLGAAEMAEIIDLMRYFADPATLGDYLTGLFALAREAAQRQPDLVTGLDAVVMGYSDTDFLAALPALRLAFSFFTPREKHYLAQTLLQATGAALPSLTVDVAAAAQAMAFEARLFAAVDRYGLG